MSDHDRQMMETAITLAAGCEPADADRIPKVGAVIAIGGTILSTGARESGFVADRDRHAEFLAFENVRENQRSLLSQATVYTTLEPCTRDVRTKPHESCTELLVSAQVKKVFVGMLDPNQGVCGKGVVELQKHGIEVELFPHDLVKRIRNENERFIRAQQTLGIKILPLQSEAPLKTYETGGRYTFLCECINAPGNDVFIFSNKNGVWWPQPHPMRQSSQANVWEADVFFGIHGTHIIHVVKASELGVQLVNFYRKIIDSNHSRKTYLQENGMEQHVGRLWGGYPGIAMARLPKGLDSQASIAVDIAQKPEAE